MKFKLDENIGRRGLELLQTSGHDVMTVRQQRLEGIANERLFEVCSTEERALLTLDRDFGQVLRFPPEKSAGVIVLEIAPRASVQGILERLRELLEVKTRPVAGEFWIVEPGRVRIHLRDREE